jgi:hypothetical protein
MGENAKWWLNIRASKEYYDSLPPQIRNNFEITKAYRTDIDYSEYPEHVEQKTKTEYKEYKKLKDIEHKINNLKENN